MLGIKNVLRHPRIGPANGVKANDGFLSPGNATNRGAFYLMGARVPPQALCFINIVKMCFYMNRARIYLESAHIIYLHRYESNF